MKTIERIGHSFFSILPGGFRAYLHRKITYSGKSEHWRSMLGVAMVGSVLFLLVGLLVWNYVRDLLPVFYAYVILVIVLLAPAFGFVFFYLYIYFSADQRTAQVEKVLPDALQMIAANLRAGATAYEAVRYVSSSEFGPLGEEFARVRQLSMGNVSFSDKLLEMSTRIDSPALTRSVKLFASSVKSGGHLAELLEGLAVDITERASLKSDLVTNTRTNSMFIFFTILVGTPTLLAVSIYFVDMVTSLQDRTGGGAGGGALAGFGGEISITSAFLTNFAYVILFVTGMLACMFIGSMIDGDSKKGLKFAPLIVLGSYVAFFIARFAIVYFLGTPG